METLTEKVCRLIAEETNQPQANIALENHIDSLADDSIRLFMLITRFEKEFGFQAQYEDLINIVTVGDIVRYLEKDRGA